MVRNKMQPDDESEKSWRRIDVVMLAVAAAIVIALILPLLHDQRRPARRSQCAANTRNLARAVIQYELRSKRLPGYVNDFGWFIGTTDPAAPVDMKSFYRPGDKKLGSWVVPLLGFLDAQPTYETWSTETFPLLVQRDGQFHFTQSAALNLSTMQCPGSKNFSSKQGSNSYIANTGMHPLSSGTHDPDAFLRSMQVCNGAFNHQYAKALDSYRFPSGPPIKLKDFVDGVGSTILITESLQAIAWHQLDPDDRVGIELLQPSVACDEVPYPLFSRFAQGVVWHEEAFIDQKATGRISVDRLRKINETVAGVTTGDLRMDQKNAPDLARPSSTHARGVNCGFADGSTRFVSETIDYGVYRALLTPCGREGSPDDLAAGTR
jgi:prepilin-type processing-associated H-X9-DG protein